MYSEKKINQNTLVDELGPNLGYVGIEGAQDERSLIDILMTSKPSRETSTTAATEATTIITTPLTRRILINILTSSTTPTSNAPEAPETFLTEKLNEISAEKPSFELPQTKEILVTLPSTSQEPSERVPIETSSSTSMDHETSKSIIATEKKTPITTSTNTSNENMKEDIDLDGSGISETKLDEGSGTDALQYQNLSNKADKNIETEEFLLENESDAPLEVNTQAAFEEDYENGSGEVELIITLPQLEGSGSDGGVFEITRPRPDSFSSGEDVFKALLDFLLPNKESESLPEDDNISFKQVFNSIGL